jgi:hypothetical protein
MDNKKPQFLVRFGVFAFGICFRYLKFCQIDDYARNRSSRICQIWGKCRACLKFCRSLDHLNKSVLYRKRIDWRNHDRSCFFIFSLYRTPPVGASLRRIGEGVGGTIRGDRQPWPGGTDRLCLLSRQGGVARSVNTG